jgi:hypothetical protein
VNPPTRVRVHPVSTSTVPKRARNNVRERAMLHESCKSRSSLATGSSGAAPFRRKFPTNFSVIPARASDSAPGTQRSRGHTAKRRRLSAHPSSSVIVAARARYLRKHLTRPTGTRAIKFSYFGSHAFGMRNSSWFSRQLPTRCTCSRRLHVIAPACSVTII